MSMQPSNQNDRSVAPYQGNSGHREEVEGMVVREQDLSLPFLRIVQPTSSDGEAGTFVRSDTGEAFSAIEVVPLALQPTRTKFPAGPFSRDAQPECWSDDDLAASTRPRYNDGQPVHAAYANFNSDGSPRQCQACEWNARIGGSENREKGMCLPSYVVALVDAESFETVMLRLQSTNTRLVKVLGAKPHARQAVMKLWLEEVKDNRGRWFQLKATAVRKLDEGDKAIIDAAYVDLRGRLDQGVDEVGGQPSTATQPTESSPAEAPPEPPYAVEDAPDLQPEVGQPSYQVGQGLPF